MSEYLIVFVISLCITMTVYLAFPVICMIRGKKYSAAKLNRIAVINSAAAWLILSVIIAAGGGEPSTNGILVWFPVSYWLLRKKCFEAPSQEDTATIEGEITGSTYCPHCYKYIPEDADYCPYCAAAISPQKPYAKILLTVGILFAVLFVVGIVISLIGQLTQSTEIAPTPSPYIESVGDNNPTKLYNDFIEELQEAGKRSK